MPNIRVIVCLGAYAWSGALGALEKLEQHAKPRPRFGHGIEAVVGHYKLIGCYHPSQQNTFTGKLTKRMFQSIWHRARKLAELES